MEMCTDRLLVKRESPAGGRRRRERIGRIQRLRTEANKVLACVSEDLYGSVQSCR